MPPYPLRRPCRYQNWWGAQRVCAGRPFKHQPACKPGSVWPAARAANVTAIPLARRLPDASSNLPERLIRTDPGLLPRRSYSVLLPVGFAVPLPSPEARCALTAPFHPCRGQTQRAEAVCSLWHCPWAGPEGLIPPDVIRHRLSVEPGLSSPAAFRHWRGAAVRPTDRIGMVIPAGQVKASRATALKAPKSLYFA